MSTKLECSKKSMNSWIWFSLKLIISLLLLGYLLYQTDQSDFLSYVKSLPFWFVGLAWVYYGLCQWISAYRWKIFLTVKGIHVGIKQLFSFYMVGMFLNNFLPGAVGGDIVKTTDLYRYIRKGNYAISSVFLERFTGLVGLTIVGVFAAFFSFSTIDSLVVIVTVMGAAAFLFLVTVFLWFKPLMKIVIFVSGKILPSSINQKFNDLFQALHSYRQHPKEMLVAILISVFLQLLFALYYALFAIQLGLNINITYFILFLPAVTLITMLPLSVGGLGIREGLMVVLFSQVGVSSAEILSVSLTVHVVNVGLSLFGGAIFLLRKPIVPQVVKDVDRANA